MKSFDFFAIAAAGFLLSWRAVAAPSAAAPSDAKPKTEVAPPKKSAVPVTQTVAEPKAAAAMSDSPYEDPNTTYLFVGARFRYVIVPKFYVNLFADGGATVGVPAFGPEFTIRKDRFEYVLSLMYASYGMDPTPFKSKTDPPQAWELVESTIKSLYVMSDFSWSSPIDPKFAVLYGAGFGIGIVFGDINRTQAFPGTGGVNDPYTYLPCPGPIAPGRPNADFCNSNDNNHFPGYSEPSWTSGGSKPIVFPWLSLQTGLRFKPSKQFMARLDVGWNIFNGPFFGLAGNYGL
jgi:hypothetical protein